MMKRVVNTRHNIFLVTKATFLLFLLHSATLFAQDLSSFTFRTSNDIFSRETSQAYAVAPVIEHMPKLNCSIEYLRRLDGKEIVYRRGPISLNINETRPGNDDGLSPSSAPEGKASVFIGGMVVDLPRTGESSETPGISEGKYRCLFRTSVFPISYKDNVLSAKIFIERAVVNLDGSVIDVMQSEVFSRTIELMGNKPLDFDLPLWEDTLKNGSRAVPSSLHESVLITLEVPQHFAFGKNVPEPFAKSTSLSYALPQASNVSLSIVIQGKEKVLDSGRREAGTHEVRWDAKDVPDGSYTARLKATDDKGRILHSGNLEITKDPSGQEMLFSNRPGRLFIPERFAVSTEAGFAVLFPTDQKNAFRNMFTHIAVRIGYRFSQSFEGGILVGQDSFNESPGPNVDVERIQDFGGVVPYTYGYAGPYVRLTLGSAAVQPVVQGALAFSSSSPIAEIGVGVRATLFSRVNVILIPDFMAHLSSKGGTKLGMIYGLAVRF